MPTTFPTVSPRVVLAEASLISIAVVKSVAFDSSSTVSRTTDHPTLAVYGVRKVVVLSTRIKSYRPEVVIDTIL